MDEAIESFDIALDLKPDFTEAFNNRSSAFFASGKIEKVLSDLNKAIQLNPDFPEANLNLAMYNLLIGNFSDGWKGFEWRHKVNNRNQSNQKLTKPCWLGNFSINKKTVLLHSEQGLGDTIQFCRYASFVAELGANVILQVQEPLVCLLQSLQGVTKVIAIGDTLPEYDFQTPLMSLPLAFKTELYNIPSTIPYINPSIIKRNYWESRLKNSTKKRIGLVWNGGFRPNQPEVWGVNSRRNISLSQISKLNNPNLDFFCLQKGEPSESELARTQDQYWDKSNFFNYIDQLDDFSDTAALIANLDLIISVDTSTAHLAAAMGKPVWLLNRFDSCWRWLIDRNDSPWYPSMRIYRQTTLNDWSNVLDQVSADLDGISKINQI